VSPRATATPRAEYRVAAAAPSLENRGLIRQASALRAGLDLRWRVTHGNTLVLQGDGVTGDVRQGPGFFGFSGFRAAIHLELSP
jgi:hypothetical protein